MTTPTQEAIQASFTRLQNSLGLSRQDFSNLSWSFKFHPNQDQLLMEINNFNKELAETLLIFRQLLADTDDLEKTIDAAYLHYVVNTTGAVPKTQGSDPFDVFAFAKKYAKLISVGVGKTADNDPLLEIDDKSIPCPAWGVVPGWSAPLSLRKVGPVINRVRYGRDDLIPSSAFGFNGKSENHTLPNAMTMADLSNLAYFGATYVEKVLEQWGYGSFQWIEDEKTDTQAFVCGKDDHLVVCFRGTSSGKDALVDARFFKVDAFGGQGKVHRGFNGALDSVWDAVKVAVDTLGLGRRIFVTGHSLGAALAQLAAHRLALSQFEIAAVYVYGSPRVGNSDFAEAYNALIGKQTFLHINNSDIVTRIPLTILGYRHLGEGPMMFDKGHAITKMPQPKALVEEEEVEFEELNPEMQQEIEKQMEDVRLSMEASTRFLSTPPELLEAGSYKGFFEVGPVDDHSMAQYLFKFGCAIVDAEWKRIGESNSNE